MEGVDLLVERLDRIAKAAFSMCRSLEMGILLTAAQPLLAIIRELVGTPSADAGPRNTREVLQ